MFKKRKLLVLYFFMAVIFIFSASGYFYIEEIGEYEKAVQKLKYQLEYSEVYSVKENVDVQESAVPAENTKDNKTVYLTFDDGPSPRTVEILDILKQYDIKATFFILANESDSAKEIIKRIKDEGHAIGVHSTSHNYEKIYRDVDSFLSDFEECFKYIEAVTEESPSIFRFPGGSVNSYNKKICKELVNEMTRRGFTYFDWNVSSDDAVKGYSEESIYNNVINGCKKHSNAVVLMHDSAPKKDTVAALKRIIPDLIDMGYSFESLDKTAQPTVFRIE